MHQVKGAKIISLLLYLWKYKPFYRGKKPLKFKNYPSVLTDSFSLFPLLWLVVGV